MSEILTIIMKFPIALFLIVVIILPVIGQNLSPSLSLVFLGINSISLPVGLWVALTLAAGVITSGIISLFFPRKTPRSASKSGQRPSSPPPSPQDRELGDRRTSETVYTRPGSNLNETEDLEVEYASVRNSPLGAPPDIHPPSDSEVWDDDEEWESAEPRNGEVETPEPEDGGHRRVVEIRKDPISSDRQGSMYSYTYRSPEDVRRTTPELEKEEEEETVDLRDRVPEPPIDAFPQMEIIDPILEPDSPRDKPMDKGSAQSHRGVIKPQTQNQTEDDWGEGSNHEEEDW